MNGREEKRLGKATTIGVRGLLTTGLANRVRQELTMLGISVLAIRPGQITISQTELTSQMAEVLDKWGIKLLDERDQQLLINTKLIVQDALDNDALSLRALLRYVAEQTHCSYPAISQLFAAVEGTTFGRYVVLRRLDKAIERFVYTDESVARIAHRTGYQDEAHLLAHLEAERGLPPAHFLALWAARTQWQINALSSRQRITAVSID